VESGLWTALRTRPFGTIPSPQAACSAIFVTALDTQPLAPPLDLVLADRQEDLHRGVWALSQLTEGPVFFCRRPGSPLDPGDAPRARIEEFAGPHPAGLPGTHIHYLHPVGRDRSAWHVGAQDAAAIGALFASGRLDVERVVSVAGPAATRPRLLRTRLGADIGHLTDGELAAGEVRVVSGSVLGGRSVAGAADAFLGRFHQQISCLHENHERAFLSWVMPGLDRFSTVRAYASGLRGRKHRFALTTTTNGGHRAMVPIGMYERVMPLDILPTFLLRALVSNDLERAQALGCLELDEDDLALCTFVCPGKEDYGTHLRRNLFELWKEA
jgi:Na+-transporting NADH:ubiquinone oxidoreductase subunit A